MLHALSLKPLMLLTTIQFLDPCQSQSVIVARKQAVRRSFPSIFDEPTVDLSVIVPAYNEEFRLDDMMKETMRYLLQKG